MTPIYGRLARWALWTVNILAACGTVVAAYGGAVNPEVTAIPAILAMTFPAWLALTVILLAADLFLLRRAAIVAGAALVACVGPIMNFAPLNFGAGVTDKREGGDEAQTFRLVTYNTYEMHDIYEAKTSEGQPDSFYREAMAEGKRNPQLSYLNRVDAQVLCMQETMMWNMNARNFCTPEQVDSFRREYPHATEYNGVSVLTALPMKPVKLPQFEGSTSVSWAAGEIDIQGHTTLVVSVHLQSIGLDDSDKALYYQITEGEGRHRMGAVRHRLLSKLNQAFKLRARQARMLRQQIDSLGYENVIIAGDFNDIPDCYAMRVLAGDDFSSAFRRAGRGPTITYHVNRFYFNIDHVLYRGDMKAVGYRRGSCRNSDHYPVEVTFRWEG